MIKPAMAIPRGDLNKPINENNAPRNHTTQPIPGIHEKINEINDNIKPAVPNPLDWPL